MGQTYASNYGGHMKDYPGARRLYTATGRRKRPLELSIIVYSIGTHYWTTLQEADNPIYDKVEKSWRMCWDDKEGKGRIESRQCRNILESQRWVRRMTRYVFKNHKLETPSYVKKMFVYPEHD
jgi:hypothetical protein